MSESSHEETKSAPTNCFRFEIAKPTWPRKKFSCAAAIGSKVSFLIYKQSFHEAPIDGRLWPNLAVWNGMIEGRNDWTRVWGSEASAGRRKTE
jgi:hypothetical protein